MNITDKMLEQDHLKDDLCPKCGAMYCADFPEGHVDTGPPTRETIVQCLGCGYTDSLGVFVDFFDKKSAGRIK